MPLAVLALTGASGCSWIVATTDTTSPRGTSFQFPDARKYQACVRTPKGPCDPRPEQYAEPADLTLAQGTGTSCSVSQVAHGVAVLRAHAGIKDPAIAVDVTELRRTNAVARRALARDPSLQALSLGPEMQELLAHGGTVPGAEHAMRALTSGTAQKMQDFYWAMLGVQRDGGAVSTLRLSATEMQTYSDAIQVASGNRAWRPAFFCSLARLQVAESRLIAAGDDQKVARDREVRALAAVADWSIYVDEYMNAYFRSGQFFDFALDPKTPRADLVKELKARLGLSDAEAKALADKIIAELGNGDLGKDGKLHLLTKLAGGFVTRGGKKLAFPDVDFTFTPFSENAFTVSKIDLVAVGADVIRVSIEAMGDSIAQLPGTKESTGCRSPQHLLDCYDPANYSVTAEQFASVNKDAAAAESMVGGITGKLVRGISWASLNNEAIARVIETALGVAARKAAEKLSWCFYACTDTRSLRPRAGIPWDGETTIGLEFLP
jgi:hypothetical protein